MKIDPIPASIVKALCAVQASIDAVAKSQFNKQGGYKFASADDIFAAVTRKFGDVGLMILPMEMTQPEIKRVEKTDSNGELKIQQWGQFHFGYILATEQDTWFDERSARTIFIQILGPQTFNAAESYCQKQFLRALLKLPTGDMDLDSMPEGETEEDQGSFSATAKRKSSSGAKKDGTDKTYNELVKAVRDLTGQRAPLLQLRRERDADWKMLPERWVQLLDDEYEDALSACRDAAE